MLHATDESLNSTLKVIKNKNKIKTWLRAETGKTPGPPYRRDTALKPQRWGAEPKGSLGGYGYSFDTARKGSGRPRPRPKQTGQPCTALLGARRYHGPYN